MAGIDVQRDQVPGRDTDIGERRQLPPVTMALSVDAELTPFGARIGPDLPRRAIGCLPGDLQSTLPQPHTNFPAFSMGGQTGTTARPSRAKASAAQRGASIMSSAPVQVVNEALPAGPCAPCARHTNRAGGFALLLHHASSFGKEATRR